MKLTLVESAGAGNSVEPVSRQYTYAWMSAEDGAMRPRGGTTEGVGVTLAKQPSPVWKELTGFTAAYEPRRETRRDIDETLSLYLE